MMTDSPYKVPMRLFFVCLALNFIFNAMVCPKMFCNQYLPAVDESKPNKCDDKECGDIFNTIYACWHMNPEKEMCRHVLLEILCVCVLIFIGIVGTGGEVLGVVVSYIYRSASRSIYAAAWCYLAVGFLSKNDIPMYRPSFCCKHCLGWSFWLPLATVSYSMYVYHIDVI